MFNRRLPIGIFQCSVSQTCHRAQLMAVKTLEVVNGEWILWIFFWDVFF